MKRNNPYPVGTPWWTYRLEKDEEEPMSDQSLLKNLKTPLYDAIQHAKRQGQRDTPPRLFWLEYDHSKLVTKNEWTEVRKRDKLACWGVVYPDGGVSLSMGSYFGSLNDLKYYLSTTGEYSLTGLEEMNKEQALKVGDQVQYVVNAVISDIDEDIPGKAALSELSVNGEPQPYIDFGVADYVPIAHLRKRMKT